MCVVRGFRLIILETLGIEPGASRMLSGEVLPLHRVPPAVKVPLATTARCSGTASAATPLTENKVPHKVTYRPRFQIDVSKIPPPGLEPGSLE